MHDTSMANETLRCGGSTCVERASELTDVLSSRWAARVLEALYFSGRPLRFNEVQKSIDISRKELSRQLDKLESKGLISRKSFGNKAPYHVEYLLLPRGDSLLDVLQTLSES